MWSEKPLATNLKDGRALVTAAAKAGTRLGCAPDTFLGGGIQTAIKLVTGAGVGIGQAIARELALAGRRRSASTPRPRRPTRRST